MRKIIPIVCSVWSVLLSITIAAAQDVAQLIRYVPADANTLAVLRVRELKESPRGKAEGWAEKHESEFLAGAVTVPPWVEMLVRASYVRPGMHGGDWTVVLLPLPKEFDLNHLAARAGTEVQEIGSHAAVQSGRHAGYFVELGDPEEGTRILGGIAPATRQDVARWLREVGGRGRAPISTYLQDAAAEQGPQIVLAIDLHDMLDPIMVRNRIDSSAVLDRNPAGRAALKVDFQSLQGVRFSIRVNEQITAELRLDFGRTIGDEAQQMRPLLVEFFNDAGAALDELEEARTKVEGRAVKLTMPLSDESLRRVLSLVTTPPPPAAPGRQSPAPPKPSPSGEPSRSSGEPDLAASRRYFNAVNRIIGDLERARARSANYARTAQWHINFADKIDRLPTANVDPQLLKFGADVSARLRALGASLRGVAVQVNALERTITYNVEQHPVYRTGFEWWWGGTYTAFGPYTYGQPVETIVMSNLQEVREKQAEVIRESEPERTKIWQMILEDRAAVERAMVDKYGPEFKQR